MKQFKNVSKRLIALLVSALMLISMIPVSTMIAFAMDSYDVTIALVEGSNPITGASITYTIGEDATTYDAVEESDGIYHLDDASTAMSTAQDNTIVISYTVTANGYDSITDTATVDADNMAINVEMTKTLLDANLKVGNAVATLYLNKHGSNDFNLNVSTDSSSSIAYGSTNLSVAKVWTDGKVEILAAGETTISVSVASDGVYKEDKVEFLLTVKEDTTAPATPSIKFSVTPDEYIVSNNTITVELESTDDETGIYKYYYKLNDSNDFVEVSGNSFTMAPQYRGTVLVKAVDNAENESSVADADGKIVILDSQAPDIESKYTLETDESVTSDNKVFTNGDITVDFTVTDTNVDISGEPVVKVNGADKALSAWDQANGKGSFLLSDEGEYTYSITYTDIANNSKTIVSDTTLVIDKTAPVISTVDGNATEWTNGDVVLKVNAADAACGGVTYSLNGGEYKATSEFTVTANGEYSFKVKDALGNESEATVVTVNKIDKDAPEIKSFVADKSSWTKDKVTITGKVEDAASGVEKLYYQKNGDASWSELTFNPNFTLVVDEECNTTYKFYCEDVAGNKSTVSSVDVKIDRTAPVNVINTISGWKKENIAITGDVTEADSGLSKVYYRLTGATDWTEATVTGTSFNFNTALTTSGTYTYDVYSVDEAGNESVISVTNAISFDNIKPTVALNALDPEGWTNSNTTVSGTVSDDLSDIKNIYYVRANGTPVELENDNGKFSFVIPNDANNTDSYVVYCVDNAGNVSVNSELSAKIDIVKPSKPTITYSTPAIQKVLQTLTFGIYKAEQVATIEATDDLSGVKEIEYTLGSTTEKKAAVDGKITVTIPVGTNSKLTAIAYDNASNNSEQQDISKDSTDYEFEGVAVDAVKPEITDISAVSSDWTNQNVVISGTVLDDNVGVEKIFIKKGTDGQYEEVTDFDGTDFSYEVSAQDYNGDYILYCVDYAGHVSDEKPITVKMDITNPEVLNVIANPDVWTNGNVVIGGSVSDNLSGVKTVYYRQGQGEIKEATLAEDAYSFEIEAQNYNGNVYVWCEDVAGNISEESFIVIYEDVEKPVVLTGVAESDDWTNENVVISGTVIDPIVNNAVSGVTKVYIKKDVDGEEWRPVDEFNATEKTFSDTIETQNYEGKYLIYCEDNAGNESEIFPVSVKMDIEKPVVLTGVVESDDWTNENVVISGTVTDPIVNNTASGVIKVYIKKDVDGEEWGYVDEFDATEKTFSHTIKAQNYEGDYLIYCEDNAGNESEVFPVSVKMDIELPSAPVITYDRNALAYVAEVLTFGFYKAPVTATITATDNLSLDTIEYLYEGTEAQYDSTVVSVTDNLIVEAGNLYSDKITITIPAEFKGALKARAWDKAGNKTDWVDEASDGKETITGLVIDTIEPNRDKDINDFVKYTPAARVVNAATLQNESEYSAGGSVIAYYNTDNTVTILINEGNFYSDDVVVEVTKDGVDYPVEVDWKDKTDDLHEGTFTLTEEGDYFVNIAYTDRSTNKMKDYTSHLIVIDKTLPDVAVDYATSTEVVLKDTDGNDREYFNDVRKATITIKEHNFRADDVVISVKAKNVLGKNVDVATFTFDNDGNVKEYLAQGANRSEWTAYDVDTVRRADDTYEMTIVYAEDANYTFDIEYTDLATNKADDRKPDYFTVDKTKPECVEVKYSETVDGKTIVEKILNTITFGAIYYNEQMEVTITAKDDISGINHFVYSYEINDNVSKVNAELLNQTIAEALENSPIVRDENSNNFTATFNIPKEALTNVNQFNGTVHFTAYDRSTNESDQFSGESTIVVDNIKPTSTVTFNDPVQKVDNVSYYDGEINATIVINEANFFSDDVKVVVTKDDANFPVQVDWKDNSVDVHTGTFTLSAPENHSGDGDYIVNVTYVDRSTNEMTPFVSNQLTIDTKDPVINVSNVKHQSANNEETISFTVSVTDTNIALESFKPTLNAVIKKDNGNNSFTYETMAIALGNATTTTNANGETVHSYTVNNLEVDGFYSLVCTAVDYANHSVSIINSAADEGGNTTVETMNFSVNREGSVFWIETEHNDKYTGETFTDKLNGAYANDKVTIKLHEINVDKVDENADKKTVFTLNDGSESADIDLKENENYSKNVIVGTGGWYETVYTLDNNNFDHDGVYSLNVITYDKAENSNVNTKTEAGTISFTLDRTNPVISANIKNDQSVNDTQFWVEFEITETNLDAETIVVKLTNNDGKTVETEIEDLGNNEYKFLVESGYNYSVEIVAKDLAGNESELYKVEHLTVSTNIFILWYANTPLFWGSIGGTVLLAGIITLLILLKKRKKNEA